MRRGCLHAAYRSVITLMSTITIAPGVVGRSRAGVSLVARLLASNSGTVWPVLLSNENQLDWYPAGDCAASAMTAALSKVSSPFSSRRGETIGFTAVK